MAHGDRPRDPAQRAKQANSFGSAAASYERARPSYPPEAVRDVLPDGSRRVLDLGAGTGKLSRILLAEGHDVVAVDPDAEMLEILGAVLPAAERHVGRAEKIPIPDASVDAVFAGQAFHWFEPLVAGPEFVRVLRPGGRFAGIYNAPEHLREVFGDAAPEAFDSESGLPLLQARFASVSRLHRGGSVLWLSQRDLQTYLDAYVELYGPMLAPDGPYPFTATRSKCVFVADAA